MNLPVLRIDQFQESIPLKGLYINSFSNHIQLNKKLITKPHSHNFYLCVLFTEGTGIHEIDFNSYTIHPGQVFFLKPGQTHCWQFKTNPEGYIFFHSKAFYDLMFLNHTLQSFPFYYSYQNPPILKLPQFKTIELNLKFQELYKEYIQENILRELKIINLISSIYIELTRLYTADINFKKLNSPNYSKTLEAVENLINTHFYKQKSAQFYANQLHITTKHLNRIINKTVNKTTSELIAERIILEAKRLIVHSNTNLSDIAHTLEFTDYAYFSKFFKSKTGITPIAFKKKYT